MAITLRALDADESYDDDAEYNGDHRNPMMKILLSSKED